MPRFKPPGQCPNCGEWIPRGALACDECGSCAKSGWSANADYDGLDLPDSDFNYDEFMEREFGSPPRRVGMSPLWWWVAVALLLSLLYASFH
jgi:hypothetical protein